MSENASGTTFKTARSMTRVLAVFVAVAVGCTTMTSSDARFVGKWRLDSLADDGESLSPFGTIEFRPNGTAVMSSSSGDYRHTVPFPWSADTRTLTFGDRTKVEEVSSLKTNLRMLVSGSSVLGLDEATYTIQECAPDRVEILELGGELPFVLTRIPD